MARSPYTNIGKKRFWKHGVENSDPLSLNGIHSPAWEIHATDTIVTMGSCFAQHIARWLRARSFNVPFYDTSENIKARHFSANYGNIYTVKQARQLVEEVLGRRECSEASWEAKNGFTDPLRPNVFAEPISDGDTVKSLRQQHLEAVRQALKNLDILVFTLGLTEAWRIKACQTVLPSAPGVVAGSYEPDRYEFVNFKYPEIMADLQGFCDAIREVREGADFKLLLTVSPVPLTATAVDRHVLQSSIYSKSVLRAVAGDFAEENNFADYFPSFEIVNNPAARSSFFEDNFRAVRSDSVETVMDLFSKAYFAMNADTPPPEQAPAPNALIGNEDVDCEEALLEGFSDARQTQTVSDKPILVIGNSHLAYVRMQMKDRGLNAYAEFAPLNFLRQSPIDEIEEFGFRRFLFKEKFPQFKDFTMEKPRVMVIAGWFLFGDNIIRAHGPIKSGFAGCTGRDITPELKPLKRPNRELVKLYTGILENRMKLIRRLEQLTAFERIYWIVAPDLTEATAEFRLGPGFVRGGYYPVYKNTYLKVFNKLKGELEKTEFILPRWEVLCGDSGFTKNEYAATTGLWDIHSSKEYFRESIDTLIKRLESHEGLMA